MRKYWIVAKNAAQNLLAYRFNFLGWFVTEGVNVLIMAYIWLSVYRQGGQVGFFSLRSLVAYYVMSRIIGMVVGGDNVAMEVADDISMGKLNNFILKPINYGFHAFAKFVGDNFSSLLLSAPIIIYFMYFFRSIFLLTPTNIILFLLSLFVASCLYFIIFFILGLSTFYLGTIFGPSFMMWLVVSLFSGRTVPLALLPSWLQTVANFLPFKFVLSEPILILYGNLSLYQSLLSIIYCTIWFLCLYVFAMFYYKIGLKKYEGFGA
jgi:ABC-2 type transport system permease protein